MTSASVTRALHKIKSFLINFVSFWLKCNKDMPAIELDVSDRFSILSWGSRLKRTKFNGAHAIPIVVSNEDHSFSLDEEALEKVLLQDHIKDRNVVVVSVAGTFRKGKSFLLNFILRYLNFQHEAGCNSNISNWLGNEDSPLNGFSWHNGEERDTNGILMWSEIFCTTLPNGEEVAIILLDTQGTFDCESTIKECTTVFALSTMLSSVQIYNLSQNIQENDLQHLEYFTEYGRLALAETGNKPFQQLQLLVRDWSYPYSANYGAEGGQKVLNRTLRIISKQPLELQLVRKHLKSCFSDIRCFLMPHPGSKVATNPKFDGRLSAIAEEFKSCLEEFIPALFSAENLTPKKISGEKIKAKDLVEYLKSYMDLFNSDELPEPKSVFMATVEANNLSAVAAAKETYYHLMEQICGSTKPYLEIDNLEVEHLRCSHQALEQFQKTPKMGGEQYSKSSLTQLQRDIDNYYNEFVHRNGIKRPSKNSSFGWQTIIHLGLGIVVAALFKKVPLW